MTRARCIELLLQEAQRGEGGGPRSDARLDEYRKELDAMTTPNLRNEVQAIADRFGEDLS